MAAARCSSATLTRPSAHSSPIRWRAGENSRSMTVMTSVPVADSRSTTCPRRQLVAVASSVVQALDLEVPVADLHLAGRGRARRRAGTVDLPSSTS